MSKKDMLQESSICYFAADLEEPVPFDIAGGQAVLSTRPSPSSAGVNEDSIAAISLDAESGVLVVADGMGGGPKGEEASRMVIESLCTSLLAAPLSEESCRSAILDALEQANSKIISLGLGAGTTAAVVEIRKGKLRSYHVGDSGIFLFGQRGKLKFRSTDHSPVGYAEQSGLLDAEEALAHEERHIISNIVGDAEMHIELGPEIELDPLDTLLLASDGLTDNILLTDVVEDLQSGALLERVHSLSEKCRSIMPMAEKTPPGKPDDLSIIAFRQQA